ncbi:phage tail tape measure protein [Pelistega indica]|uniref:phage tail tape measure protein n=1 Tax=Pelistega indica TaxID=1414851 RepID=UPI00041B79D4|nr:phage tail tape measure protein [Pelistega indica]
MILEELLVKVGVKTDTRELSKLELSLKNLPAIAGVVGAVAAASIAGLSAFVSMSLNALDSIHQLSNETGVAADKIYLLGKVAELNGSSVEAAEASYKGLSKAIGEAANGIGLGAKAFENFGIKAKNADGSVRDASEVLEDIREKMQGLSNQQQIAMLAKIGIDASLIQTLRLTNEEMAEALSNAEALSLGVGTQENAATAAAFQDSLAEVGQIAKGVAEYFSLRLAPALMRIIGLFRDWFIENNQLIRNGLSIFAGILAGAIDVISALANVLNTIIGGTIGWKNALYGLVAVFAIVKKA